jgi:hypothetical protein
MSLGAYQMEVSTKFRVEPIWPGLPMREILRVAFRDKMISDRDHAVLRALRGEA